MAIEIVKDKKQGVMGRISFPLGQDEIAIGRAISCLLEEGWKFRELTKTEICLERFWEYDPEEYGEEEVKEHNKLT